MSDRRRIAPALAIAALALALSPGTAGAATATVSGGSLIYTAAAGETNNATLSLAGADYRVSDPGVPITPMAGCAAVSASEVACPASGVTSGLRLLLGNQNDSGTIAASVSGPLTGDLRGDVGNDVLRNEADLEFSFLLGDEFGGPPGDDTLFGGPGAESIAGNAGNDIQDGGGGDDNLGPEAGSDVMNGGEGGDRIFGGNAPDGADIIIGGPGSDSAEYFERVGDVGLTANGVADDGEGGEGDNLAPDVEQLQSGEGNDTILGGPGFNGISGGDGNDSLDGGEGHDGVFGGNGDDALFGGPGDDQIGPDRGTDTVAAGDGDDEISSGELEDEPDALGGGPGTDLLSYDGADGPLTVTLDDVADDGVAGEGDNAMSDIEDVRGTVEADTIVGNASANQLDGGAGDDLISGLGGSDGLAGERGNDSLDGGEGNDLVEGASGADRLRTRDGDADEATCGAGVDAVLADARDSAGADCEDLSEGVEFTKRKAKLSASGKASVGLACPGAEAVRCDGKLTLRKGKRKLGSERFRIDSGEEDKVKVKVGSPGGGKLTAEAVFTDSAGAKARSSAKLKLVRKGGS